MRTNELSFGANGIWELREFHLSAATGTLSPVPVALTPDRSFNFGEVLADFINQNEPSILAEKHTVPESFAGQPFQAGAIFNDLGTWFAPGVSDEARHKLALNTCNGCHSAQETGTFFLQIDPRFPGGGPANLSGFLTGITVSDPQTGELRTFNDLGRRNSDLKSIVCPAGGKRPDLANLRKGIDRVH